MCQHLLSVHGQENQRFGKRSGSLNSQRGIFFSRKKKCNGGCSSVGRTEGCDLSSREFESRQSPHYGPVANTGIGDGLQNRKCGFDSHQGLQTGEHKRILFLIFNKARLAQWRLRLICNEEIPGVRVPYLAPF